MGIERNSFTRLYPPVGMILGTCDMTSTAPVLSNLSGLGSDQSCVSVTDTATGLATIAVTNFKGPRGIAMGFGTGSAVGTIVTCSIGTYSGDTASFAFGSTAGDTTAADLKFNFQLWAY